MWWGPVGFSLVMKMRCVEEPNQAFPLELLPSWHRYRVLAQTRYWLQGAECKKKKKEKNTNRKKKG